MRSSYRVFRIFGISVELHVSFLLFLLLLFVVFGVPALLYFILLFAIVLAHELCHSVVAKGFGIKVPKITLLPIGGLASVELPETPLQELAISISGPLFNFLLAGLGVAGMVVLGISPVGYDSVVSSLMEGNISAFTVQSLLSLVVYINLVLGGLNALPAFPMDGGRILRSVLALWLEYVTATRIALLVGQLFFLAMILWGFVNWDLWLVVIGVFLSFAGSSELRFITFRKAFKGVTLGDIASRDFRLVNEHVAVREFLDLVVVRGVRFYFVVDFSGNVRGLLDLNALGSPKVLGTDEVGRYAGRGLVVAEAKTSVDEALKGVFSEDFVVVADEGRLVGFLTADLLQESSRYFGTARRRA